MHMVKSKDGRKFYIIVPLKFRFLKMKMGKEMKQP